MAPAVPFALLGVVQLASVVVWLGVAATACLPRVRRRTTPLVVTGALGMAVADTLTAVQLTSGSSNPLGELRDVALALLAVGFAGLSAPPSMRYRAMAAPAIVAPLGARPSVSIAGAVLGVAASGAAWLGGRQVRVGRTVWSATAIGLLLTALASAMAGPARHNTHAALVLLCARGAATAALATAMVLVARDNLFGKLLGSIVAGVVAMAVGAVAVVGIGVAGEVQHDQSQRLLTAAKTQQRALQAVGARAVLLAQVVAQCPAQQSRCVAALKDFAQDARYFAVIDHPGSPARTVAPRSGALDKLARLQLVGSSIARGALAATATSQTAALGPLLLDGSPPRLAIVAAVPGRPASAGSQGRPTFAAIYGIVLGDAYLDSVKAATGYDVSIVAGNQLLSTSLDAPSSQQVLSEAIRHQVGVGGPAAATVVASHGQAPTAAFVPINEAGNDNVRIATLAVSQPASIALATQRSILRRLVLTALVVLVVIALLALVLAQRIVEPVHQLTVAARRVQAGDLDAVVASERSDEVGSLGRAFDAMTSSLRGLTGDLREAAQRQAGLRARLEAIVRAMTDGLVTTGGDGLVAGANPKALQLLGCEAGDVIGRPLTEAVDLRAPDGGALDLRTWAPTSDAVLQTGSGGVTVRFAIAPIPDQPGEVLVIYDRTRDREIERMKTEFLSNISHELRTPLTPIRGYAELLARRQDLPPEQVQQFVAEILAGATRMNRAVELLVDVASLEADRIVSVRRHVNVAGYADERLAQWRDRYPGRAPDLRRRVAAGLPEIDIDPVWLSKALDELVDNAVKYTAPGRTITLAAAMTDDGLVRISVRDTGEGIDTSRLGELLGDFSQADASETRRVGGLGLGLGFVSRVADQLGVRLHVDSTRGHGAEFGIDVAVALPEIVAASAQQTSDQRQAKKMKTRR